jgi:head-tail adaptor
VSIGSRLTHTVTIERSSSSGDPDDDDEYGQPVRSPSTIATVRAAIQPKSDREVALTSQAGAALSDYRIYLLPTDLTTADAIIHDAQDCPMRPDLPDARFEIVGVPDAAGLGHHLEVDARFVEAVGQAGS